MKLPIPAFFGRFSSPVTEIISGLLTVLFAWALLVVIGSLVVGRVVVPTVWVLLVVAQLLSLIYERWFDAHGFDWSDVGQRANGIVLGVAIWGLIL